MIPPAYAILPWLQVTPLVPVVTRVAAGAARGDHSMMPHERLVVAPPVPFSSRCLAAHEECRGDALFAEHCARTAAPVLARHVRVPPALARDLVLDAAWLFLYAAKTPTELETDAAVAKLVADAWEERSRIVEPPRETAPYPAHRDGAEWGGDYNHRKSARDLLEGVARVVHDADVVHANEDTYELVTRIRRILRFHPVNPWAARGDRPR